MFHDFQGTNADQDNRFSDKEKKLLKQMKFEEILSKKVKKLILLTILHRFCSHKMFFCF